MVNYYIIYFDFDFTCVQVKGTYEAAKKYGETILKEDFGIRETDLPAFTNLTTNEQASSYQDLFSIIEEENNEDCFLDTIYNTGYDIADTKDKQWILNHRDDFYDILNDDGTCKKKHLY